MKSGIVPWNKVKESDIVSNCDSFTKSDGIVPEIKLSESVISHSLTKALRAREAESLAFVGRDFE